MTIQRDVEWWRDREREIYAEIREVDRKLDELHQRKRVLYHARRQAYRRVRYVENEKGGTAQGQDAFWIVSAELIPYIQKFLDEYSDAPIKQKGQQRKGVGGTRILAERADINRRTIQNIMRGHSKTTTFQVADRILTAIGRTDVLDEDITVYTGTFDDRTATGDLADD